VIKTKMCQMWKTFQMNWLQEASSSTIKTKLSRIKPVSFLIITLFV
jgi:hypothetical protein